VAVLRQYKIKTDNIGVTGSVSFRMWLELDFHDYTTHRDPKYTTVTNMNTLGQCMMSYWWFKQFSRPSLQDGNFILPISQSWGKQLNSNLVMHSQLTV